MVDLLARRSVLTGLLTAAGALAVIVPGARAFGTVAAGADPVFAAIERHDAARAAYEALLKVDEDHPLLDATGNAEVAAWNAFIETPVTSVTAASAYAGHLARYPEMIGMNRTAEVKDVLECLATSLAQISGGAITSTVQHGTPLPAKPDPVHDAIAKFRKAASDVEATTHSMEGQEFMALMNERDEAMRLLALTKPTTKDGAHALMSEVIMDMAGSEIPNICASPLSAAIGTLLVAWPEGAVS
jgi:hypothetical protein